LFSIVFEKIHRHKMSAEKQRRNHWKKNKQHDHPNAILIISVLCWPTHIAKTLRPSHSPCFVLAETK